MTSIGIALSGGGHRATVWALGVLMYLVDSGRHRDVVSISSVSGGSIANGVVAHAIDYAGTDGERLRAAIRPALLHIAREGLFFWGRLTNAYVVTLLAMLAIGTVLPLVWLGFAVVLGASDVPVPINVAAVVGAVLLLFGAWLFSRRSAVVERALARAHFGGAPGPRLADVRRPVEHVFCATELQSGYHVYLSPKFVYSYRFGHGAPANLTLACAVQSSACMPFAFATRRLPAEPHEFPTPAGRDPLPRHLTLTDGGVYDNMAEQWLTGMANRLRSGLVAVAAPEIDEVVVVNAGGVNRMRPLRWLTVPFLGDLLTVKRASDIMYAGTTSHRRQELVRRGDVAEQTGQSQRGALVQTSQTPYTVADAFASGNDARAKRARETLDHLARHDRYGRDAWVDRARADAAIKTVLRRLRPGPTAGLLEHAYLAAMYGLHTLLDYPLLAPPSRASFEALVNGEVDARPGGAVGRLR